MSNGCNNKTTIVVGSGPSLNEDQIQFIRDQKDINLIVVNDTYRLFIDVADSLYAADLEWWKIHYENVKSSGFKEKKWMPFRERHREFLESHSDINSIECVTLPGLSSENDDFLHCNGNSGAQAINLAVIQGAKRIILFGFDMKVDEKGKEHWFGNHVAGLRSPVDQFSKWIERFEKIMDDAKKMRIDIINCSCPDSGLKDVVPFVDFREIFLDIT